VIHRCGVSPDAVRRDSQDTLGDSARHALEPVDRPLVRHRAITPARLLRAASGIFGEPPGLYPDDVVVAARQYGRIDHDEVVEGTNHYSIVRGARGAAGVAAHGC
jgi:lipase